MDPQAMAQFLQLAKADPEAIRRILPLLQSIGKNVSDFGRNTPDYVGGLPPSVQVLGQEEDKIRQALEALSSVSEALRYIHEAPLGGRRPDTKFVGYEELKRQVLENPYKFIQGYETSPR
jgi:hypothetical protein